MTSSAINSNSKLLLWCGDTINSLANSTSIQFMLYILGKTEDFYDYVKNNGEKLADHQIIATKWKCPGCNVEENSSLETDPNHIRILSCFHQLCSICLEAHSSGPQDFFIGHNNNKSSLIICPICHQTTPIFTEKGGFQALMTKALWQSFFYNGNNRPHNSDFPHHDMDDNISTDGISSTSLDNNIITSNDAEKLEKVSSSQFSTPPTGKCPKHPVQNESYRHYCNTCNIVIECPLCFANEHLRAGHDGIALNVPSLPNNPTVKQQQTLNTEVSSLISNGGYVNKDHNINSSNSTNDVIINTIGNNISSSDDKSKAAIDVINNRLLEYDIILKNVEKTTNQLNGQYLQAKRDVGDATMSFHNAIEARKSDVLKEIESSYVTKHAKLAQISQKLRELSKRSKDFVHYVGKSSLNSVEINNVTSTNNNNGTTNLSLNNHDVNGKNEDMMNEAMEKLKPLLTSDVAWILYVSPDLVAQHILNYDIEFITYSPAIPNVVKNAFGHVKDNMCFETSRHDRLLQKFWIQNNDSSTYGITLELSNDAKRNCLLNGTTSFNSQDHTTGNIKVCSPSTILGDQLIKSDTLAMLNAYPNPPIFNGENFCFLPPSLSANLDNPSNSLKNAATVEGDAYCTNNLDVDVKPPNVQIKRRKMIYHSKFGEFGLLDGQFTEPSGVTVNAQGDIIVADTNNHRIQIFDREGRFKYQFGECGKRDGQLLYPNRVATVRASGDIVVTERSPTHQIQIFTKTGQFVRKFGADILQHPRGVAVDDDAKVVIVECKVMRVVIFDSRTGDVVHKFGCSKHLEFPNGLAVNNKQEIFISDNRAHSVKVFDYTGQYLRQIGAPGLTNYPIGVGIEYYTGRLIVADNHNNFNLTIFDQQGNLLDALESKVKHAQCFDVAILAEDSVVVASKDFRVYVYRYNNGSCPVTQDANVLSALACFSLTTTTTSNSTSTNISNPNSSPPSFSYGNSTYFPLPFNSMSTTRSDIVLTTNNPVDGLVSSVQAHHPFEHPTLSRLTQHWQHNYMILQQKQQQQLQQNATLFPPSTTASSSYNYYPYYNSHHNIMNENKPPAKLSSLHTIPLLPGANKSYPNSNYHSTFLYDTTNKTLTNLAMPSVPQLRYPVSTGSNNTNSTFVLPKAGKIVFTGTSTLGGNTLSTTLSHKNVRSANKTNTQTSTSINSTCCAPSYTTDEMAETLDIPLRSLAFYQPQYWSPYDNVLAFVNDALIHRPTTTLAVTKTCASSTVTPCTSFLTTSTHGKTKKLSSPKTNYK